MCALASHPKFGFLAYLAVLFSFSVVFNLGEKCGIVYFPFLIHCRGESNVCKRDIRDYFDNRFHFANGYLLNCSWQLQISVINHTKLFSDVGPWSKIFSNGGLWPNVYQIKPVFVVKPEIPLQFVLNLTFAMLLSIWKGYFYINGAKISGIYLTFGLDALSLRSAPMPDTFIRPKAYKAPCERWACEVEVLGYGPIITSLCHMGLVTIKMKSDNLSGSMYCKT